MSPTGAPAGQSRPQEHAAKSLGDMTVNKRRANACHINNLGNMHCVRDVMDVEITSRIGLKSLSTPSSTAPWCGQPG
jgi:hypothetical protein